VVVAYGLILPRPVLEAPRLGCYNVHASLLPRWRGAAPIQRAIMAGDKVTGVSIMQVTRRARRGAGVSCREPFPSCPDTTAGALHDKLASVGADLIGQALHGLETGDLACTPQPRRRRHLCPQDRQGGDAHRFLARRQRRPQSYPWPVAPSRRLVALPVGPREVRVKVLKAELAEGSGPPGTTLDDALTVACGDGAVSLLVVQREGRSPAEASAFLRGLPVPAGTRLA
jgi:methionyl-tRNA formyltransferase